jgi:hypothetical protein
MRAKLTQALTVGVCLLMLCVSSFASVCQLSCSLPQNHQHASAAPGHTTSASMNRSHCAHMQMRGSCRGSLYSVNNSGCVETSCWRPDVLSSAVKTANIAHSANNQVTALVSGEPGESSMFGSSSVPIQIDRRTTLFSPLSPVLRI